MSTPSTIDRARLQQPGSPILEEFRAWMQAKRAGMTLSPAGGRRSFEAAQDSRYVAWAGWDASINSLLQAQRVALVARSRHWARNTGTGRRFLSQVRNGVVGPVGFTLQMRCGDWTREKGRWVFKLDKLANDAIERAWLDWCRRGTCEVTGRLSFADVCKLVIETAARDGEYLGRHLRGVKDNKYRYQLQVLSTDRLDHQHNVTPLRGQAGEEVRMGVHRDSSGRATRYSILRWGPSDGAGARDAELVPASEVLHDFVTIDAEQARGVPWCHATLTGSKMLSRFEEFAVVAAQVGASQQGFIEQPETPGLPVRTENMGLRVDAATGELSRELKAGAIDVLPPGATFRGFDAKYPTEAFDPFVSSRKRDIAAGLDVAYHNLTGDMTAVNYSSARIAELGERDQWRGLGHWFVGSFVDPVFRAWLEMALLAGQVTLASGQPLSVARIDKYFAGAVFRGRGWDWVDPLKEVTAATLATQQLFTTRSQVVASKGGDFEDNVLEIAQEQQILKDNDVAAPGAAATASSGTTDDPAPQDSGDGNDTTSKLLRAALRQLEREGAFNEG